ncbi:MAG: very-short-patch-repair endonuclease [Flavobacterium sp.]
MFPLGLGEKQKRNFSDLFVNSKKQIRMKKNPLLSDNMWKDASGIIFSNAKKLRENPTEAEEVMWLSLRNNQLDGYKFRRQHPLLNYVADFYCHQLKLVIEIDGEYHQTVEQKKLDNERTENIEFQGLKLMRFTNEEVISNISAVLNKIKEFLKIEE